MKKTKPQTNTESTYKFKIPIIPIVLFLFVFIAIGVLTGSNKSSVFFNNTTQQLIINDTEDLWTVKEYTGCEMAWKESRNMIFYSSGKYSCVNDRVKDIFQCYHTYRGDLICERELNGT